MDKDYNRMMQSAVLRNGILTVPGFDESDYIEVAGILRRALLQSELPHFKAIGARVSVGSTIDPSFVDKIPGSDKSYAELLVTLDNLVYVDLSSSLTIVPRDQARYAELISIEKNATSSNGAFILSGKGVSPQPLILDEPIINWNSKAKNNTVSLVMREGTGMFDFNETYYAGLYNTDYKPMRAVYDLTNVFTIRLYKSGDNHIKFCYKKKVNEEVLLKLLTNYMESR